MFNLNPYSSATMAYHKSSAYHHHTISLLDRARQSSCVNKVKICNSSDFLADKAILLLHLNQNISPKNFKITECKAGVDAQVYPNGIIQLSFDHLHLKPGESMHCTYRFELSETKIKKENIVKKTYLFFFQ